MSVSKFYRNFAHVFLLLLLSAAAVGCKYRYIEKPERLLSPEEMSEVICELAYLNVVEEQGAFEQDSVLAKIGKKAFVQKLYEQYGIDKQILQQNNEYYMENNKLYVKIYSDALNRLNIRLGEEEKKQETPEELTNPNGWDDKKKYGSRRKALPRKSPPVRRIRHHQGCYGAVHPVRFLQGSFGPARRRARCDGPPIQ